MNYAQIRKFDVTNGPGIRTTLFVSGCTHNCKGCFNKEQQDFNYGDPWTKEVERDFIKASINPMIEGINILGGEPMQQINDIDFITLISNLKTIVNKPIWVWTGYTFEQLIKSEAHKKLLSFIDVLIDGKYEEDKKDIMLKYRGSSNQRIINVKESLMQDKLIELNI